MTNANEKKPAKVWWFVFIVELALLGFKLLILVSDKQGLSSVDLMIYILSILVSALLLLGLFGYISQRKIFQSQFWKIAFISMMVISISVNYQIILVLFFSICDFNRIISFLSFLSLDKPESLVFTTLFAYLAIFRCAYQSSHIWITDKP